MRRLPELLAVVLLSSVLLTGVTLIIFTKPIYWVDLIIDDGYYYLGIAKNIAESGLSSFRMPLETNGYQPLWLILLSLFAIIFGTSHVAMSVQIFVLSLVFCFLFFITARKFFNRGWLAVLTIFVFPSVFLAGMETVMLAPLLLLFFFAKNNYIRGGIGSLIFLTRLDSLAILVSRDAYNIIIKRNFNLMHWIIIGPVAAFYLGCNYYFFGSPLPVSGLAKSIGAQFFENIFPAMLYSSSVKGIVISIIGISLIRKKYFGTYQLKNNELIITSLGAILICMVYYSALSGWPLWGWYYWPVMFTYFLALQELFEIFDHLRKRRKVSSTAIGKYVRSFEIVDLTTLIFVGYFLLLSPAYSALRFVGSSYVISVMESVYILPLRDTIGRENIKLIDRIDELGVQQDAFWAMGDRAGSFGFFLPSSHKFFHTEGLVGDLAYIKAMRQDEGEAFVKDMGITHFVADREVYFEDETLLGIAEPIQGMSSKIGPWLLCFNKDGIISDITNNDGTARRLVIEANSLLPCSLSMKEKFHELRLRYGGLRKFTLPSEHTSGVYKWVLIINSFISKKD